MFLERLLFDFGGGFEQYLSPIANIVSCPQVEAASYELHFRSKPIGQ
jgi:hypothetical protein